MKYINKIIRIMGMFLLIVCLAACQTGGGTTGGTENPGDGTTEQPGEQPGGEVEENYCIKFETNAGEEIESIDNLKVGDVITLPTPTRDGY